MKIWYIVPLFSIVYSSCAGPPSSATAESAPPEKTSVSNGPHYIGQARRSSAHPRRGNPDWDKIYSQRIIGTWLGDRRLYVFYADGTWSIKKYDGDKEEFNGRRWHIQNGNLHLEAPWGDPTISKIISISQTELNTVAERFRRHQTFDGKTIQEIQKEVNLVGRIGESGMTARQAGEFFGWGGKEKTKDVALFSRDELETAGWTREMLLNVAEGYRILSEASSNNDDLSRAEQLENLANLFGE